MSLIIIAAVSENGCIGQSGSIPWHYSEDFKHFKNVTFGHTIVMGRKTFESIGKALPGRENLVLTSSNSVFKNASTINRFEEILGRNKDVYICGGARLYKEALSIADKLIITHIPGEYEGDTFFPMWPIVSPWQEVSCKSGNPEDGLMYKVYKNSKV